MDMRSMRTGMLVVLLLVTLASVAFAGPINCGLTPSAPACAPTATFSYTPAGGGATNLNLGGTSTFSNGSWLLSFDPQELPKLLLFTGGDTLTGPDPFVGFAFGVINHTKSNLTFSYDFVTPFGGGPYSKADTIFADVLIDTAFTGTSTVSPVADPFIMESYVNGVKIPGFGRGSSCTTVGFVCVSGASGLIGPVSYLSAGSGTLEVKGQFTLTPSSQFSLTGRTELYQPVPEPGSLALVGSGLIGLAGVLRRKRKD
jgi:hypothetical protein